MEGCLVLNWGIVVLAGGEEIGELANLMGTPFKAMARVSGTPSVELVVARAVADGFQRGAVIGCEPSSAYAQPYLWSADTGRAVGNAVLGVDLLRTECDAFLFLAADTPLIVPGEIARFCSVVESRAHGHETWYAAGACTIETFKREYPEVPAKGIKLREGRFVTGTLFATNAAGLAHAAALVDEFREHRKSAVKMLLKVGVGAALKVAAGLADQAFAERTISNLLGGTAILDLNADPSTCLDFDNPEEWRALLSVAARKR